MVQWKYRKYRVSVSTTSDTCRIKVSQRVKGNNPRNQRPLPNYDHFNYNQFGVWGSVYAERHCHVASMITFHIHLGCNPIFDADCLRYYLEHHRWCKRWRNAETTVLMMKHSVNWPLNARWFVRHSSWKVKWWVNYSWPNSTSGRKLKWPIMTGISESEKKHVLVYNR